MFHPEDIPILDQLRELFTYTDCLRWRATNKRVMRVAYVYLYDKELPIATIIWKYHDKEEIPPNHRIAFIDGDITNSKIENLYLKKTWLQIQKERKQERIRLEKEKVSSKDTWYRRRRGIRTLLSLIPPNDAMSSSSPVEISISPLRGYKRSGTEPYPDSQATKDIRWDSNTRIPDFF